jgi:hypothetical protein
MSAQGTLALTGKLEALRVTSFPTVENDILVPGLNTTAPVKAFNELTPLPPPPLAAMVKVFPLGVMVTLEPAARVKAPAKAFTLVTPWFATIIDVPVGVTPIPDPAVTLRFPVRPFNSVTPRPVPPEEADVITLNEPPAVGGCVTVTVLVPTTISTCPAAIIAAAIEFVAEITA